MDAQAMFKVMGAINNFKSNHPKFVQFLGDMFKGGIEPDTIIEITVTKPGAAPVTSNIKVRQSDLDLFESLKNGIN